jgi:N-acetylglucosamine kinase-like BadF-type ATPase
VAEQRYVVGIHSGRTTTDAILVTMDGALVTEQSVGPTDLRQVGVHRASRILLKLIQSCCRKASCSSSDLYAIGIGVRGADRAIDRTEFQSRLSQLSEAQNFPLTSLTIETSVRVVLEAAFASGPGIVLQVEAGSIGCAKGEDGKVYLAGGGGRALGDEGGAYSLSCDGLNAALRAYDGRGPRTLLLDYALEHFATTSMEDLITSVSRRKVDVVSFLPEILKAEEKGDHVAHSVLFRGAADLADIVRVLTLKVKPKRKLAVSLAGEILESENPYSKMVKEKILSSLPQVVVQKPKFPPAFGGVIVVLRPFEFRR